jgi:hypothetical protein
MFNKQSTTDHKNLEVKEDELQQTKMMDNIGIGSSKQYLSVESGEPFIQNSSVFEKWWKLTGRSQKIGRQ